MASKPPKPPDAFLSYTRFDDQHDGGAISEFRRRLADAVRAVTGEPFEIFQDVDGIGLGEHWPGKLDRLLDQVRFFIPILTPSYFQSKACRDELEKFLKAEKDRGRNDLVLPIYYIRCAVMEDPLRWPSEPLAGVLHERQRWDWRELRFKPISDPDFRRSLEALAVEIDEARARAKRQAEDEARERAEQEARRKAEEEARRQAAAAEAKRLAEEQARKQAEQEARRKAEVEARSQAAAVETRRVAEEKVRKQAEQEAQRKAAEEETRRIAETRQSAAAAEAKRQAREEAQRPAETELHGRLRQPAARSGLREPGTVFRDVDAPWCPEMVVIPPGEFMMGSTEAESASWSERFSGSGRLKGERGRPQHPVRIAYALAVGRYPVTFDEYGPFAHTTVRALPCDEGWGGGRRPVVNVNWEESKAYVAWLAVQTGQPYRLLSEAEWEYACRAGTTTRYWWGDKITPENANYGGKVGKTTEVGSYPPNPFGLYDIHGNVWEWVEDRWHDSYTRAPDEGSAWTGGTRRGRVLRGGSWEDSPGDLRSAVRYRSDAASRLNFIGFRVARTLTARPAASPVKDTHRSSLEYHDPELTGRVTFNYSNNNGCYSIGQDEFFFETKWSKASDQSIHLYSDPPSIAGVAEAPQLQSYRDVMDLASYDISSRVRTLQEGEHAILKNRHNKYAVLRILDIKDRTRSDTVDELAFEFWILTDTT